VRSADQKAVAVRVDPLVLGRVFLAFAAGLTALTVPVLDAAPRALVWASVVCGGLLVLLALSFVVPWQRLDARATLAFPAVVCLAIVVLSTSSAPAYSPLAGLLSLCFAYIGLTQPPRTTFVMLPLAGAAFVFINGGWSAAIAIRLFIAACVWTILGELLSRFNARQSALSEALRAAAHTDILTGVANRRGLELRLASTAAGDVVAMCDLDHFKKLNDTEGHHVGDQVLADFGSMLRATLRSTDYCARYGGEEFVLILPATTAAEAVAMLARLHANWEVLRPGLTFSAGIATFSAQRSFLETLGAADRALYAAKAAGRNCDRVEDATDASTAFDSEAAPAPTTDVAA
jgi:diguanylate cyclase (GGDEF)-like protein